MSRADLHRGDRVTVEVDGLPATGRTRTLRISIIDDALADAEHHVLSSAEVPDWDGTAIAVELPVPGPPRPTWAVFAHAGDEPQIRSGDWLTTTSHRVNGPRVRVELERV